jgi:hypothetical protein
MVAHGVCALAILLSGFVSPVCALLTFEQRPAFKWVNAFAASMLTIGFSLMSRLRNTSNLATISCFEIICGISGGIWFPGRLIAVQASQKTTGVAIATAMVSFFTNLGQSFGITISGAVVRNRWDVEVGRSLAQPTISPEFVIFSNHAERTATIIKRFPEGVRQVYMALMAHTIGLIWIVVASFADLALLATLGMENISLQKTAENVKLEGDSTTESVSRSR